MGSRVPQGLSTPSLVRLDGEPIPAIDQSSVDEASDHYDVPPERTDASPRSGVAEEPFDKPTG